MRGFIHLGRRKKLFGRLKSWNHKTQDVISKEQNQNPPHLDLHFK